jgi:hypothetical protein
MSTINILYNGKLRDFNSSDSCMAFFVEQIEIIIKYIINIGLATKYMVT